MTRIARNCLAALVMLTTVAIAWTQASINSIQVMDSSGHPTPRDILTQEDATVLLTNAFPYDGVIQLWDCTTERPTMTASASMPANTAFNIAHGQAPGIYKIRMAPAGGTFQDVGMLKVSP